MSPFAVLVLCVQACLIQSAMSMCGCGSSYNLGSCGRVTPAVNLGSYSLGNSAINSVSAGSCSSYGGVGTGQVGVAGNVDACGNTVVVGSVPVLGAVDFSGRLPASGCVSIAGQCGCGCL